MSQVLCVIIFSVTLTLLSSVAMASETLGELTQQCAVLETYWKNDPPRNKEVTIPSNADAAICFGYMQGILGLSGLIGVVGDPDVGACSLAQDGSITGGPRCRAMLGVCLPKAGASYSQTLAVFLAYARSHPAQWHEAAAIHYLLALTAAFPCKYK
jgi:hypothetical protein